MQIAPKPTNTIGIPNTRLLKSGLSNARTEVTNAIANTIIVMIYVTQRVGILASILFGVSEDLRKNPYKQNTKEYTIIKQMMITPVKRDLLVILCVILIHPFCDRS